MNSKLFKLCLSAILALSFNACGGDSNDDDDNGGGGNNVKCTAGDVICSPDGTSTLVCNAAGNGYDKGDTCDNGCENNACINGGGGNNNEPVCTANARVCKNNEIMTCKSDGSGYLNNTEPCEFGCETGATSCNVQKCTKDAKKCSDDGSKVLTCNADGGWDESDCELGCEAGRCVKACQSGETQCAEDGSALLSCDNDGNWVPSNCQNDSLCYSSDDDTKCNDVPDLSYDACSAADLADCLARIEEAGYDPSTGVCLVEDGETGCYLGKCTAAGSTKVECSTKYSAMVASVCSAIGNDGSGVWEAFGIVSECAFGCNEDLTACAAPLVSDQGQACDASRADRCDGDILSYCDDGEVVAGKCKQGASCIELNKDGSVWADCYSPSDACTEDSSECYVEEDWFGGEIAYLAEITCLSSIADANKKYPVYREYECPSGACADDYSCAEPLVSDLGQDCTPESRASRCDGDVYSFCNYDEDYNEGAVAAADCVEYDYDLCTVLDSKPMCYNKCTAESAAENICYFDDNYDGFVIGTKACVKDDAGANIVEKKVLTQLCASGCNNTNDGCAYADEGKTCDASSMAESCQGNTAVYCYNGKIGAENCPGLYGDNMICYMNDDDESYCAESCSTENEVVSKCSTELVWGIFEISYQSSQKCTKTKDNKLILETVEGSIEYCDDQGCNGAGTACIAVDDSDY